jgi:hypothetical protein
MVMGTCYLSNYLFHLLVKVHVAFVFEEFVESFTILMYRIDAGAGIKSGTCATELDTLIPLSVFAIDGF